MKFIAVALSCVGMLTSPVAGAVVPVVSASLVAQAPGDVALHTGGVLVGQLLDAQGVGVAAASVTVQKGGQEIARVITSKDGKFAVAGLKGGVHLVSTPGQQGVYRLWAPRTAPPAARKGLMLVSNTDVVRGQCGCGAPVCGSACGAGGGAGGGGVGNWIATHPIITAGAIAAAVAIPLALDDDDSPPATP